LPMSQNAWYEKVITTVCEVYRRYHTASGESPVFSRTYKNWFMILKTI
jgi:hypothetical protein